MSVEAIKRGFKYDHRNDDHRDLKVSSVTKNVITVDGATEEEKGIVQHLAKHVINVVENPTLGLCKSKESELKHDSRRSDRTKRRNINEIECQNDMEDLNGAGPVTVLCLK